MPENGAVKFQWVATLFAGVIAGLLGWFVASIESDKSSFLTIREYEVYVRSIDVQLKEIHDRVREINERLSVIELKLSNFPTRQEINDWLRTDVNKDTSKALRK